MENRWPFRIHATYDESIRQFLDVFERVDRDIPFNGLRFIIDHAETIRPDSIERINALGGGIAIQHRMAFQGEYFVQRYGADEAQFTPPVTDMLAAGVPVGAGTDATRVASFNPWVSLYWLVSGRTLGGLPLYPEERQLDREQALRLWTKGSAWFSGEQEVKGAISRGEYADLAVLSADYFSIPSEEIKDLTSVLTMVGCEGRGPSRKRVPHAGRCTDSRCRRLDPGCGGDVVHGTGGFSDLAPSLPPASPDWSPVRTYGGHYPTGQIAGVAMAATTHNCSVHGHGPGHSHGHAHHHSGAALPRDPFWGPAGCGCFAF